MLIKLMSLPEITEPKLDQPDALESVKKLFDDFALNNIRYCHWKSNLRLEYGLLGRTDLDLLVDPAQQEKFRRSLAEHNVKLVLAPDGKRYPGIEDYLGFDFATGNLYHLHVHYQLVLGEQFVKNYHIPLEEHFLNSTVSAGGWVNMPAPELELSILCLRALLKYRDRDALKDILSIRSSGIPAHIMNELNWLSAQTEMDDLTRVLAEVSDILPAELILKFLETVSDNPRDGFKLWRLRSQARQALGRYQRRERLLAAAQYFRELWRRQVLTLFRPAQGMTFPRGGMTITLIGADGSGKTSLCHALAKWLSWKMDVQSYYMGSKKPSRLSAWLYLAFRMARRGQRELEKLLGKKNPIPRGLAFLRQILLYVHFLSVGEDRYRRYRKGKRQAGDGSIVIFDRFPYESPLDGPEIQKNAEGQNMVLVGFLSQREQKLYGKFTLPDYLIILDVTPEVSVKRKPDHSLEKIQGKKQAIDKLQSALGEKTAANWANQNADLPFEDVLLQLKRKIWAVL